MEVEQMAAGRLTPQPERRAFPRQVVEEEATLLLVNIGARVPCRLIDLGLEGCRLRTAERFLAGILIRVEVAFKVNGIAFRFSGVTEWTDEHYVTGIRFVNVTSRRRDELAEVLCEIEAKNAAKAEQQAAKEQAPREQVRQEPVQEPPLRPALQSESAKMAQPLKPAGTPAQPQPANQPAAKRERRAQSRHEVDTSAVIFLVKIGSKLSGRIVDLSLGGCRIRTDERFPVGIYTRVETEFRIEGLPFRLGGVIQAVHDRDRHSVGIHFLDLSDRKREQVEQLIEEIEEMRVRRTLPESVDSGEKSLEGWSGSPVAGVENRNPGYLP
jgi:hypothetical protein